MVIFVNYYNPLMGPYLSSLYPLTGVIVIKFIPIDQAHICQVYNNLLKLYRSSLYSLIGVILVNYYSSLIGIIFVNYYNPLTGRINQSQIFI